MCFAERTESVKGVESQHRSERRKDDLTWNHTTFFGFQTVVLTIPGGSPAFVRIATGVSTTARMVALLTISWLPTFGK
jgi:hypothetical protein